VAQLASSPDWRGAAQDLLRGCDHFGDLSDRVDLIETVARSLGDMLYPAFIQILCVANSSPELHSKQLLTQALVQALRTGRLPTGKLSAWGVDSAPVSDTFGQTRSLGPVEYLCAWYAQPSGREPLSELGFRRALGDLLALISLDTHARALYCTKLTSELQDPLGGALARPTRSAMAALLAAWSSGQSVDTTVNEFITELARLGNQRLQGLGNGLFTQGSYF
jgi:hypothetical protein